MLPQTPPPTALLVVRSLPLADAFTGILRASGFDVLLASSPAEARDVLARDQLDLLMVDIDWGAACIATLAEAARARLGQPCGVVAVVGWWDARVADIAGHADALVYKPPTERQVQATLDHVMERRVALALARGRAVARG